MVIKNLVLSGAQIKGIAYIGVLKALEELDILSNLENILGVSSGAIFSFIIVLGLSSSQVEKIVNVLTLDHLRDINSDNVFRFNETYGFDTCNSFCKIFKVITKKILGNENATFSDLKKNKPKISLNILAANLTTKKEEIFNYENTPDMPLWLAVRISMSIPIYFTKIEYNNNWYSDGVIVNNYPIDYFDNDIDNTLGVTLTNCSEVKDIDGLGMYMYRVLDCIMSVMETHKNEKYRDKTFKIYVDYNIMEFRFDTEIKKRMINEGYTQFMSLYEDKFGDTHDTSSISTINDTVSEKNLDEVIDIIKTEININQNSIDLENIVNNE